MLKWVFGADTGPFKRGLNDMRKDTQRFSGSVKGMLAGAFGIAAITASFRSLFVELDRVQKLAIQFGESAETIQRVSLEADLAGTNIEKVAGALAKATKNALDAADGTGEYVEHFERLNINAEDFVGLSMEDKLVSIASGMAGASNQGEAMATVMELMGGKGRELIPLLQEVSDGIDDVGVASDRQIENITKFNDQMTRAKQTAQTFGADIVSGIVVVFGSIGVLVNGIVEIAIKNLQLLVENALIAGDVLKKAATLDLIGAGKAATKFADTAKESFATIRNEAKISADTIKQLFTDNFDPDTDGTEDAIDAAVAKAEKLAEKEEERKKLVEEIAELEEDARQRTLKTQEKILEAEQKRADLIKQIANSGDENETLTVQKEKLEIEKELEKLREKQAKEKEKDKAKAESKNQELTGLREQEASLDRDIRLSGLSDEDRLKALQGEQGALQAQGADQSLSEEERTEARIGAKSLQSDIDSLGESLLNDVQSKVERNEQSGPVIASSSLAEIAGGGPAAMFGKETTEQRQVELSEEMVRLLEVIAGQDGETNVIPPSA